MKKHISRILVLILVLAMVASFALPAFAAHSDHSITINETKYNHTYEAYQIFTGEVVELDGNFVLSNPDWGTGVDTTKLVDGLTLIEALKSSTANPTYYTYYATGTGVVTAADVIKVLSDNRSVAGLPEAFAALVGKYLSTTKVDSKAYKAGDVEMSTAELAAQEIAIAYYKISGLHDGYYLIKEYEGSDIAPETHTDYMLELVKDVTITPKDGEVTVTKKVQEESEWQDTATNNIGDTINFRIVGELPGNYDQFTDYEYIFADTMSAGLTLDVSSIKVWTYNGDDGKLITSTYYEVKTDSEAAAVVPGTNLVIRFPDLKQLTKSTEYTVTDATKIRVEYQATLNSGAAFQEENKVKIVFDNNPYKDGHGETPEDKVFVFDFTLDVIKKDGRNTTDPIDDVALEGAKFLLYRERSGHAQYVVLDANSKVKGWTNWINEDDVKDYVNTTYPALSDTEKAAKVAELIANVGVASELSSGSDGKFFIQGLDEGDYWLKETVAPTGYTLLDAPIKLIIDATYPATTDVAKLDSLTIKVGETTTNGNLTFGTVATTVINNPGRQLPSTGGIGTTLFYVFGGLMAAAAVVLLVTKRRMAA